MKKQKKYEIPEAYEYQYKTDYQYDWDIHENYVDTFDAYESMLVGLVYDSVSKSIDSSRITDSYAATLAIERAARVMGKLPDGEVEAIGKADAGKAAFMDILRQKWIYPNANAQHPFKVKLRLWQLYSSVYGYMPMFFDWNVRNDGYTGPDCWLWNPRLLVPQAGRVSISDMDYVTALTDVSKKYLESALEDEMGDGWNKDALKLLIGLANNEVTDDTTTETAVSRNRNNQSTKKGIRLATRYEAGDDGEWITFAPDYGCIEVRRLKNPHKNGKIPFVVKYSQPLFDSFYGLGDFQRAKPLQFARDGLTNFYFKGIKMNLIPPLITNANGVLKHTIDYREGAVMQETVPNSIRRLETSTAGLQTYQAAQTSLTGSLLSLYGSQNAAIPGAEALNPSQGKTPAAIDLYSAKEATRDGQEQGFLEEAIEQLTDGFFSLIANIGTEDIPVQLFAKDIEEIVQSGLADVTEILEGFKPNESLTGGQLVIKPDSLKGAEYKFNITPGSSSKVNKEKQMASVERIMATISKYQNVLQDDPNVVIQWGELLNTYEELSDVKGAGRFVQIKDGPSKEELAMMQEIQNLQQQNEQLNQALMQAQSEVEQTKLTPPPINVGGNIYSDPDIAQAAAEFAN